VLLDLLRELLSSIASILKDIPVWPKPSDGVRYVILHVESGQETNYVTCVNDIVRASIPIKTGLMSDIGREFRILRRTTVTGQQPQQADFRFYGKLPPDLLYTPLDTTSLVGQSMPPRQAGRPAGFITSILYCICP
jgi:hypothetical protein